MHASGHLLKVKSVFNNLAKVCMIALRLYLVSCDSLEYRTLAIQQPGKVKCTYVYRPMYLDTQ